MNNAIYNLNKEESIQYMRVVSEGNSDDMFNFAYALGWKNAMQKMKDETEKFINNSK